MNGDDSPQSNYDFQWGRSEVVIIYPDINVYLYNTWLCYDVGSNGSNVGYDMVWCGSFIHMTGL